MSLSNPKELIVSIVMNVNETTEVKDELLAGYKDSLPVVKEVLKESIEEHKKRLAEFNNS